MSLRKKHHFIFIQMYGISNTTRRRYQVSKHYILTPLIWKVCHLYFVYFIRQSINLQTHHKSETTFFLLYLNQQNSIALTKAAINRDLNWQHSIIQNQLISHIKYIWSIDGTTFHCKFQCLTFVKFIYWCCFCQF